MARQHSVMLVPDGGPARSDNGWERARGGAIKAAERRVGERSLDRAEHDRRLGRGASRRSLGKLLYR